MPSLQGKTVVITGASRGIGRAIALAVAARGGRLVLAAKTANDGESKLPGSVASVAAEVEAAGGEALPLQVDVRDEARIAWLMQQAVERFGGIDAVINNAGAIRLQPVASQPVKQLDLMWQVNVRASYACAHYAIPHLRKSSNAHILMMSPPIRLEPEVYGGATGYTLTKYGMTLLAQGLAQELRGDGIAVNALWPRTTIATAAVEMLGGDPMMQRSRTPDIVADAVMAILESDARTLTGRALLDEDFLRERGVVDFDRYAVSPGAELLPDLYV